MTNIQTVFGVTLFIAVLPFIFKDIPAWGYVSIGISFLYVLIAFVFWLRSLRKPGRLEWNLVNGNVTLSEIRVFRIKH